MFRVINLFWSNPGQPPKPTDRTYKCAVDLRLGLVIPFTDSNAAQAACDDFNNGISHGKFCHAGIDLCYYADTLKPLLDKSGPVDVSNNAIINILGLDYVVPSQVSGHILELRKALAQAMAEKCDAERAAKEALGALVDQTCDN